MKKCTLFPLFIAIYALFISNLFSQEITYSNLRDGNGISVHLSLNEYEITSLNYRSEVMHEISLSGIFIPNDAGMPNLPRISRFVAIPQGAEVRVAIKSMETETLQNINIAPALRIQAIPEEPVMDYVKEERVYTANQYYPQNCVEVSEVMNLRGINTVMLGITPFQFNPITKELIVINNIEIEIEYISGSRVYDDPKYRSPWFDPILKNALLNYEVLPEIAYSAKSSKDGEGCEYLIVIPNREDFRPFAEQILEYRTKQGIYTKIMSLEDMGVSTTTQLKSFFHNAYNTWDIPPVAVLLMADHNTNMSLGIPAEVVPHPYPQSGSCITDNQYADVTGDLLPEMVFGRMAAENEAQMAVLVSKFIEYETQPCMEPSYYQNPITALGWQTERWFQICSEAVGGYWRKHGKTPVRINAIYSGTPGSSWSSNQNTSMVVNYFGPSGTGYIPATPAELGNWSGGLASHVTTAVNNGAFALQHRDHGFENGWGEPAFQSSHINTLTNVGKMTYVFTINCLTGKFNHSSPCFGELFHRYTYQGQNAGCVGFLGPTEISYSFVNDAFAWGMYDLFDPDFLPTYGPQGPHSAAYSGNWMPAFGNVAGKYFLAQSNWPYNTGDKNITYQMFTAHSDVFLRLYTEVPVAISAIHPDVTLAGNPGLLISANEGTLISLTAVIDGNLEILDIATATGEIQSMNIPSTLPPTTEINVVITGQNFLRYEAIISVVPAEGPYIVPNKYTVVNDDILTYISSNSEIAVTLKNVGIEPNEPATVTISSSDPQLTINNATASCGSIAPDGTAVVHFNVTIANDIPDNKSFTIDVTVTETGKSRSWESKLTLKAFAPVFSLEKVIVNGIENGNLEAGAVLNITTVVKNKGGADAFNVKGDLEIKSPFISIACEENNASKKLLPANETTELTFSVVTDSEMNLGHIANIDLLLNAQYERSHTAPFAVSYSNSNSYCSNGNQNCGSNDKFSSVILYKTSDPGTLLINKTDGACSTNGYQDYTNIVVPIIPGEEYTIKLRVAYTGQRVKGWFDLNGNDIFDANEQLITISSSMTANTEYTQTFTVPNNNYVPGTHRFRLVCKYNAEPPGACNNSSYGQTHDYSIILPELYPRVQNVEALLTGTTINITWEAPENGTPNGYNIYRNGNKLNEALLTTAAFEEENFIEGVYTYKVTAVFDDNKESFAQISNVICLFLLCDAPQGLTGISDNNTALLTWSEPRTLGAVLGYNIYRDGNMINESLITNREYRDEELENGIYVYQILAVYELLCEASDLTEGVEVVISADVNDLQTNSYKIYPNPTTGNITISGNGLHNVEIYDIQGRKLAEYNNINEKLQINVNNYDNGIYLVRLYSENDVVMVKRLVVIK